MWTEWLCCARKLRCDRGEVEKNERKRVNWMHNLKLPALISGPIAFPKKSVAAAGAVEVRSSFFSICFPFHSFFTSLFMFNHSQYITQWTYKKDSIIELFGSFYPEAVWYIGCDDELPLLSPVLCFSCHWPHQRVISNISAVTRVSSFGRSWRWWKKNQRKQTVLPQ